MRMTGKEEKPIMIIRNLSNEDVVKPHIAIANQLQKEKDELEIRLTKYKRAFEILKEKTGLEVKNVNNLGRILHKLYYGDDESTLEQDEYELLEELMGYE